MARPGLVRWCGRALAAGGLLTFLLNATLTPLMVAKAPLEQTAASTIFLYRQSLAILVAALLLLGTIGLYSAQSERAGVFGGIAFVMALLGSALLLAWEWINVFLIRELALRAPAAVRTLETAKGFSMYDLGALIPITLFSIGWIVLEVSTLRAWKPGRRPAIAVIAGFFLIPILSAAFGVTWGGVAGNAILGFGWFFQGRAVAKEPVRSDF